MRIKRIEVWPVPLRLTEPYQIAYETVKATTNIILRLETNTGVCGYGAAAPDEHVTGETPSSVLRSIDEIAGPTIKGADPLRPARLLERLKPVFPSQPSALAAVDMALYDILGKVSHLPLWKLLGGYRDRIRTSVTIGILPKEETVERAHAWIARGFRCLKLKGGIDVEADIRGWKQPSTIEGVRPDVIARKGSHETAVEVETRESVGSKRDEKQKEAFKDWSKGDPTKHFKRIMTDE